MKNENDRFQEAIDGLRGDAAEREVVAGAAGRVWERLSESRDAAGEPGCAGFQGSIGGYLRGELPASRAALLEDHIASCVTCRRAFRQAKTGTPPAAATVAERPRSRWLAVAAALVAAVGATALFLASQGMLPDRSGRRVAVVSVEGQLLHVGADGQTRELAADARVDGQSPLRTAKGSRAVVQLADGSQVELGERSEISVRADRRGRTIDLSRGSIIVEAAPQRGKHLFVATDDCLVSVTGTIFSVNHGTKGSRVSVVEGEVWVDDGRDATALHPGDQRSTDLSVGALSLDEELSWSRNRERYRALLGEIHAVAEQVAARTHEPPLPRASRLLQVVPEDTVVYTAIPNVSDSLATAHRVLMERMDQSPVLQGWWSRNVGPKGEAIARAIGEVRDFGAFLGDEIVLVLGESGTPLLLAEVRDAEGFRRHLAERLARAQDAAADAGPKLRLVDVATAGAETASPEELQLWIGRDVFAASFGGRALPLVAEAAQGAASSRFAGSSFHAHLLDAYGRGARWFLGADLARIGQHAAAGGGSVEAWREAGFLDAETLLVMTHGTGAAERSEAVVTFAGPRRGIASWLAAPAPMGSIDFVSPQAHLMAAVAFKDPASMADDLVRVMEASEPGSSAFLQRLPDEIGVRLRDDLAAPLGGELALALDGPLLPLPSWKVIVEVYDPVRLQAALAALVNRLDVEMRAAGKPSIAITSTTEGGLTFHRIGTPGEDGGVHYVMVDGYALFGPRRALLAQAIANRNAGHSLARTRRFRSLLPQDGHTNFSALVYQDIGELVAPIAAHLRGAGGGGDALDGLLAGMPSHATLGYAYAQDDRIVFTSDHGPLGLGAGAAAAGMMMGAAGAR